MCPIGTIMQITATGVMDANQSSPGYSCLPCSMANKSKPEGTIFTGTNCTWACPDPPYVRPYGGCLDFSALDKIPNGKLAVSSSLSQTLVKVCDAGFFLNGTGLCQDCQVGMYCDGMNFMGVGSALCPYNLTSLLNAKSLGDCYCPLGYSFPTLNSSFPLNTTTTMTPECKICQAGYYCPSPYTDPVLCNDNATSKEGSVVQTNCTCNFGYYGPNGGPCNPCPERSYCPGGTNYSACPPNTYMSNETICKPDPGYYGAWGQEGIICPLGAYCPGTLQTYQLCPNSSTTVAAGASSVASCVCVAGYYGIIQNTSSMCKLCPAQYYCPLNSSAPTACPAESVTQTQGESFSEISSETFFIIQQLFIIQQH